MNRHKRAFERMLFHYAAEHEGRKQSVVIGKRTLHCVECGPVGALAAGDWALCAYWLRITRSDGRWIRFEFTLDGKVRSEQTGTALEAQ